MRASRLDVTFLLPNIFLRCIFDEMLHLERFERDLEAVNKSGLPGRDLEAEIKLAASRDSLEGIWRPYSSQPLAQAPGWLC